MKQAYLSTSLRLVPPTSRITKKHRDAASNHEKVERNTKIKKIVGLVFVYAFLAAAAIIVLFPFYYMIAASFMTQEEAYAGAWFPELSSAIETMIYNYSNTFERLDFMNHVGTTLIVAISTTILQLLTTILASYAFARLEFRGRDVLFICFLATMMIPGELLAIANYTTMANLGFINKNQTYGEALFVMIVPLIASSFYIYLLRQNFKQIPEELYLASKVDGKSDWQFLWKVMAPLSSPTLITIAILSFIGSWNSYVWPNRAVYKPEFQVISVVIRTGALTKQDELGNWVTMLPWQMTASVLTVLPLLILFIVFRKYIMSGTGRSGIKG